jgi:prevent-host-death family protein
VAEIITAAVANRNFFRLLRSAQEGKSYVVTRHGRSVAKIVPVDTHRKLARQEREILLTRPRAEPVVDIAASWDRDELYEDTP